MPTFFGQKSHSIKSLFGMWFYVTLNIKLKLFTSHFSGTFHALLKAYLLVKVVITILFQVISITDLIYLQNSFHWRKKKEFFLYSMSLFSLECTVSLKFSFLHWCGFWIPPLRSYSEPLHTSVWYFYVLNYLDS